LLACAWVVIGFGLARTIASTIPLVADALAVPCAFLGTVITVHLAFDLLLLIRHVHLRVLELIWARSFRLRLGSRGRFLFYWLAIIRIRVVVAIAIIPCHTVLISWGMPQVQVAIGMVVSVGLTVPTAAEPPWRSIRGSPSPLRRDTNIHWTSCTPSTTILGPGDIDNPMRASQWFGRVNEDLPVCSGCWCKELGAHGAAVLLRGLAHIQATLALDEHFCGVLTSEGNVLANASSWASRFWLQ